ncbi:MAG: DUF1700 domain-containing protein [Saccharofermentans sp.]|nr:DUF1700 domain-containing protein [Saccharofermentans sp.]
MNRVEYINKLKSELGSMAYNDVTEIINDIEDHFAAGIAAGKSEEVIAEGLGNPVDLAKEYKDGMDLPKILRKKVEVASKPAVNQPTSGTVCFCILMTVFVAIPTWFTLLAIILGIFVIELSLLAGAIGLLVACWGNGAFLLPSLLGGITLALLSVTGYAILYFAIKYFMIATKAYIRFIKHTWHNGL